MTDLVTETAVSESQDHEPVRIFLSYASEVEEIMTAVSQSLDRLRQLSNGNIRIIYDKKSLEISAPVPLIRDISDKLLELANETFLISRKGIGRPSPADVARKKCQYFGVRVRVF